MSLHIGMTMPNRSLEKTSIEQSIIKLAEQLAIKKTQQEMPSGSKLDLTFMLSTANENPEFKGMIMGNYTKEDNILYFKTAVPYHLNNSEHTNEYVSLTLQDMVNNADEFFKENQLSFNVQQWQSLVNEITARLDS